MPKQGLHLVCTHANTTLPRCTRFTNVPMRPYTPRAVLLIPTQHLPSSSAGAALTPIRAGTTLVLLMNRRNTRSTNVPTRHPSCSRAGTDCSLLERRLNTRQHSSHQHTDTTSVLISSNAPFIRPPKTAPARSDATFACPVRLPCFLVTLVPPASGYCSACADSKFLRRLSASKLRCLRDYKPFSPTPCLLVLTTNCELPSPAPVYVASCVCLRRTKCPALPRAARHNAFSYSTFHRHFPAARKCQLRSLHPNLRSQQIQRQSGGCCSSSKNGIAN